MYTTILTLWKQGKSKSEIARVTGKDRKTVRQIIQKYEQGGQETPTIVNKGSRLNQHHAEIVSLLESDLTLQLRINDSFFTMSQLREVLMFSSPKRGL